MKKMGRKMITGMMFMAMMLSVTGCKADEPVLTDADVVTEEQTTEKEPEIHLSIGQESLNVAFTLDIGESRKLDVNTDYAGDLEYLSSDEAIVTVDRTGTVTAVSNGLVKMTVIAGDVERHVNVVVKEPVGVAAEKIEGIQEPVGADVAANEASNTVRSNQAMGTTEGKNSANGSGSNTTATSASGGTTGNTTSTEAPASTFNPEDYYLDWYYIADQVNARLKAEYPNATIGSGFTWEGTYYEAGWSSFTEKDGLEGVWTTEAKINDIYSSIKYALDAQGIPNDVPGAAMGMVVNGITVNADGTRTISITCYR